VEVETEKSGEGYGIFSANNRHSMLRKSVQHDGAARASGPDETGFMNFEEITMRHSQSKEEEQLTTLKISNCGLGRNQTTFDVTGKVDKINESSRSGSPPLLSNSARFNNL